MEPVRGSRVPVLDRPHLWIFSALSAPCGGFLVGWRCGLGAETPVSKLRFIAPGRLDLMPLVARQLHGQDSPVAILARVLEQWPVTWRRWLLCRRIASGLPEKGLEQVRRRLRRILHTPNVRKAVAVAVCKAVAALRWRQIQILVALQRCGWDMKRAGETLGIGHASVRRGIQRCVRKLARQLERGA